MRRFNKQFFAAKVSNRIMREFEENSMISCEVYDMIELFYRASGCKNPEEFCSRFVLTNGRTGECFQVLFYEEDEGFDETWGWVIDTNSMEEIIYGEEPSIDHEEDC